MPQAPPPAAGQRGFTYIGLLITIAAMAAVLAATAQVWHTAQRREKERELLFIGEQFRRAMAGFARDARTPGERLPKNLDDLVKDPRALSTRRYLRRIYADPMTGKNEWALVKQTDGGIIGIHSLSEEKPLKTSGFGLANAGFENKEKYSEWVFLPGREGQAAAAGAANQPPQPQPPALGQPLPAAGR